MDGVPNGLHQSSRQQEVPRFFKLSDRASAEHSLPSSSGNRSAWRLNLRTPHPVIASLDIVSAFGRCPDIVKFVEEIP